MKKRVVLTFPPTRVSEPLTFNLVKQFDLMVNILRGVITPTEEGRMVVELSGARTALDDGIQYLKSMGVGITSLAHEIKWHPGRCTHCTACIPMCPTDALHVNRETMEVEFTKDQCIACELCVSTCPYHALVIHYSE